MPMFSFICSGCQKETEKFINNIDEVDIKCEACGETCERQFSQFRSNTVLDAKTLYNEKILPDVKRISDNIDKGKDADFLDICGEE
jgi:putative FmdB family regulatory protein